jgi:hypothetical protein
VEWQGEREEGGVTDREKNNNAYPGIKQQETK